MVDVERLAAAVKHYSWGSRTAIPELCGQEPADEPIAELWMGAHPAGPSSLPDRESGTRCPTLLDAIAADPVRELGDEVIERYGPRLPYLLKILAAAEPLSIQTHPTIDQAVVGFAREDAAGIELSDFARSFKDQNHKPELIVAVGDFEALIGFRPIAQTLAFLDALDLESWRSTGDALRAGGLADALQHTLLMSSTGAGAAAAALTSRAPHVDNDWVAEADLLARIAARYSADPGLLTAGLMNRVVLTLGQSVLLGPGILHCYVGGVVVEIMANSDNVLRGGLTTKHVDAAALLETVVTEPSHPAIAAAEPGEATIAGGFDEFALTRLEGSNSVSRELRGPEIVLCIAGSADCSTTGRRLTLGPGESAWIPCAAERHEVVSEGESYIAAIGT